MEHPKDYPEMPTGTDYKPLSTVGKMILALSGLSIIWIFGVGAVVTIEWILEAFK